MAYRKVNLLVRVLGRFINTKYYKTISIHYFSTYDLLSRIRTQLKNERNSVGTRQLNTFETQLFEHLTEREWDRIAATGN